MADSMRKDYLAPKDISVDTPAIDKLMVDSLVFHKTYSQASFTTFSFGSFLTGRYPWDIYGASNSNVVKDAWCQTDLPAFPSSIRTIFSLATEANFDCASFTHPVLGKNYPYASWGLSASWKQYSGSALSPYAEPIINKIHEINSLGRNGLIFIRSSDTHIPWTARDLMFRDGLEGKAWECVTQFVTAQILSGQQNKVEEYIAKGIRRIDQELIKPILNCLLELGVYDESVVIMHSDHGDMLWDRLDIFENGGAVGHDIYPWQPVVHVPLMIKFPNILELVGRRMTLIELRDLYFVVSLLISAYANTRNDTYRKGLFDDKIIFPSRTHALGMTLGPFSYCTDGQMKLVYNNETNNFSLFDTERDPLEENDILSENPTTASILLKILKKKRGGWAPPPMEHPKMLSMLKLLGYKD